MISDLRSLFELENKLMNIKMFFSSSTMNIIHKINNWDNLPEDYQGEDYVEEFDDKTYFGLSIVQGISNVNEYLLDFEKVIKIIRSKDEIQKFEDIDIIKEIYNNIINELKGKIEKIDLKVLNEVKNYSDNLLLSFNIKNEQSLAQKRFLSDINPENDTDIIIKQNLENIESVLLMAESIIIEDYRKLYSKNNFWRNYSNDIITAFNIIYLISYLIFRFKSIIKQFENYLNNKNRNLILTDSFNLEMIDYQNYDKSFNLKTKRYKLEIIYTSLRKDFINEELTPKKDFVKIFSERIDRIDKNIRIYWKGELYTFVFFIDLIKQIIPNLKYVDFEKSRRFKVGDKYPTANDIYSSKDKYKIVSLNENTEVFRVKKFLTDLIEANL